MTLPLPRSRPTTARRITPLTLAASAAAVVALFAAHGFAQPRGGTKQGGAAAQSQGLPLPPGYRPRTPAPQAQPQRPAPGSGGTVMYFQKPADAPAATGGPGSSAGVAQLNEPVRKPEPAAVLEMPASPPASRYLPQPPAVTIPAAAATPHAAQPDAPLPQPQPGDPPPSTSQKKQDSKIIPVPDEYVRLPPREDIFKVYNDPELERAIMERIIQDRIKDIENQIRDAIAMKKDTKDLEKTLQDLRATLKDPFSDTTYRFPPLPVISPPGVAYRPKTAAYEPRQVVLEPGYVVHRRLHFEEPNAERQGWDLGPFSTLVSSGYFVRDALVWPQSLASGCVHGFWDTNAGKCLPGSPTPYYLYPPGLTLTGSVFEAGAIIGTAAVFP